MQYISLASGVESDADEIIKFNQENKNSIPKDFDDEFYQKTYPDVENFFTPFCLANNISDRVRLYFHWIHYGKKQRRITRPTVWSNPSDIKVIIEDDFYLKNQFKNNPLIEDDKFLVSYCSTVFNRTDQAIRKLKDNIEKLKQDEQIVLVDFENNQALIDKIYSDIIPKLNKLNKSKNFKFISVKGFNFYNCPVAKNISHYYSDGKYVVNLDIDNDIDGMRNAIEEQIQEKKSEFILHLSPLSTPLTEENQKQKEGFSGSFGRICFRKKDFIALAGYNEMFLPMGYQDSDIIFRAIKKGYEYINKPVFVAPEKNAKRITYSTNAEIMSWEDCNDFNKKLSKYNIQENNLTAVNVYKNYDALILEGKSLRDIKIIYFNCSNQGLSKDIIGQVNLGGQKDIYIDFLNYDFKNYELMLDFYFKKLAEDLLYQSPDIITAVTKKMKEGVFAYAESTHRNKKIGEGFYDKSSKPGDGIIVNGDESRILNFSTSGSSTGEPYLYFHDAKYFSKLQDQSEFGLIKKEYGIQKNNISVLMLINWPGSPSIERFSETRKNFQKENKYNSFSATEFETTFLNYKNYQNIDWWYNNLLNLLSDKYFDIVLISASYLNFLTKYIKNNNFKHKFANLICQTSEFLIEKDFNFLKENGNVNNASNHMKGWDGGANFFTCKYGTYHLNDAYSFSEDWGGKLITTDYFNLVYPFLEYWNGDLCKIENEYKKCSCGRYYRPFSFTKSREFGIKGKATKEREFIQKAKKLEFFNEKLEYVQYSSSNIFISLKEKLTKHEEDQVKTINNKINYKFII